MANIEQVKGRIENAYTDKAKELNLSNLGLTGEDLEELLPVIKDKLPDLKKLDLGYNELESLPDGIGQLENLQELYLGHNQLEALPDGIGELEYLQELNLESNKLSGLPDTIADLKNLQILQLGHNRLESLPDGIGQLENLQDLFLEYNQLEALPDGIGQLENLQYLLMDYNRLRELPESIGNLQRFRALTACYNLLTQETGTWLDATFGNRPGFFLSYNMAAHGAKIDHRTVLKHLYGDDDEKMKRITRLMALLGHEEFAIGQRDVFKERDIVADGKVVGTERVKTGTKPERMATGKEVLKEFLEKFPMDNGPLQELYDATLRHLLEEIPAGTSMVQDRGNKVQEIATSCGDCATPVKDFLLRGAVHIAKEHPGKLDPEKMDAILEREALQEEVCRRMEIRSGDQQELLQGLINSVYLQGAEDMGDNKIRIRGDRKRLPSKSAYPGFAFRLVKPEHREALAHICCKEENGMPVMEDGMYAIDQGKLDGFKERYMAERSLRDASPKEKLIGDFKKAHGELLQSKEGYTTLIDECFHDGDVAKCINTNEQAEDVRKKLDGVEESRYRETMEASLKEIEEILDAKVALLPQAAKHTVTVESMEEEIRANHGPGENPLKRLSRPQTGKAHGVAPRAGTRSNPKARRSSRFSM